MDYFFQLLSSIKNFSFWGYFLIFLLSFFESFAFVGLVIPGSLALIFAGFLVAQGVIDIGDLFVWAALGAILGDSFSFFLGKRGTIAFREENKVFKPSLLSKGEGYFKKHGAQSVFFGRFFGWLRPIIPFVAGLFKLNWRVFLLWNVLSGLLWAASHITIGYFFGQGWQLIVVWSTRVSVFVAAVVTALVIFYLLKRFVIKKGRQLFAFSASVWRSVRQAIAANPDVQKFKERHALLFRFLKRRLDKNRFFGLPASLLVLVFIYAFSLLGGIIEDVITSDPIAAADTRIANLLAVFRGVHITTVFLWITLLGKWQIVLVFMAAAIILLWLWRKRLYIVPLFITILGSEVFTYLGKFIIHRPRPEVALYTEHTFSFPSGHATIAVAFYGFIAYLLMRNTKLWQRKVNIFFAGLLVILLIGFSRLYLGVHYVSDVWGGYLIGALWLIIGISVSEWLESRKKRILFTPWPNVRLASALLVIFPLLFYAGFAQQYNPQIYQQPEREGGIITDPHDIFSSDQLKFTETIIGDKQEPLSFIILAQNDGQLIDVFRTAGWYLADDINVFTVAKHAKTALFKESYITAPMTPSFWNAQVHDFGFEKSTDATNIRERHHARFWKTQFIMDNGKRVYVGTASLDRGVKWLITHTIAPDIDSEREFLFQDFKLTGNLVDVQKEKFVRPTLGKNFSGDPFFTDGLVYLIKVK